MNYEELSGYEKIKLILENYTSLVDRLNYLKANIDNVNLKHSYRYDGAVKGFNSEYLSDIEKIEDIKEKRLMTIGLLEYFLHLVDSGISYLKDLNFKHYEIIELYYIKGMKLKQVASKLGINPVTVSKNKDKLIQEIAHFHFDDILESFNW
ncbi:hypothetical protein [Fusobacterium polymorphum]|uniref:hypothetical protein n=1 Tax=Fusobacterium nucleatum subsp. polymorphum TaxID=76857 RepID=UPI002B4BC4E0|nr:hypothetical protein [Fusobacterium polymorphum]WRL71099.1 hypothetical protein VKN81_01420 [Fusobacterium polymorphum]